MALGFVVAGFGLLLGELAPLLPRRIPEGISTVFGTVLIATGGSGIVIILAILVCLQLGALLIGRRTSGRLSSRSR